MESRNTAVKGDKLSQAPPERSGFTLLSAEKRFFRERPIKAFYHADTRPRRRCSQNTRSRKSMHEHRASLHLQTHTYTASVTRGTSVHADMYACACHMAPSPTSPGCACRLEDKLPFVRAFGSSQRRHAERADSWRRTCADIRMRVGAAKISRNSLVRGFRAQRVDRKMALCARLFLSRVDDR